MELLSIAEILEQARAHTCERERSDCMLICHDCIRDVVFRREYHRSLFTAIRAGNAILDRDKHVKVWIELPDKSVITFH